MDEVLVAVESSDPLVARLVAFCDEHQVEAKFEQFSQQYVDAFHGVSADGEHSHQAHEIFQRYEELFEAVAQSFLRQEQLTAEQFFAHCRTLQRSPSHEDATGNLQMLLSALDFEAFCELMEHEAIQTQAALKAAEDMGL